MAIIKVEEGRKLTEIKFGTDHYLANLLACTKILGVPLNKARTLCKRTHPDMNIKVDPPIPIISKYTTDQICNELDEYEITISISVNQKLSKVK